MHDEHNYSEKQPPNNYQLFIRIIDTNHKLDALLKGQAAVIEQHEKHQKEDDVEHALLHQRISTMRTFGSSIAVVAAAVGFVSAYLLESWSKIKGHG